MTFKELFTLITRVGEFSKTILLGDPDQSDLNGRSGFIKMIECFDDEESRSNGVFIFRFTEDDIVRSGLVLALDAADRNSCGGQPTTNLLTYSNALNNAIWVGYCGSTSNITYNTTDITDPIGTNTAVKIARNNVAVCGGGGNVS